MPFHLKAHHTIIAVASVLLSTAPVSRATTIAAVVTPENIVIAADTLVTKVSAKGPEGIGFAQKIEVLGPNVVAVGGLVKAGNNLFDVSQLVSEACRNSCGVDAQAEVFASLMRRKLPALVAAFRQQSAKKGSQPKLNSSVWFCGLESRHPVIYGVESAIGLGEESQPQVTIKRFPPYAFPQGSGVIFLGPDSLRGRHFELNPMRLREVTYLVSAVGEIVRAGIADPGGRSGGAITIIHISKEGPRVLSRPQPAGGGAI